MPLLGIATQYREVWEKIADYNSWDEYAHESLEDPAYYCRLAYNSLSLTEEQRGDLPRQWDELPKSVQQLVVERAVKECKDTLALSE